MDADQKVSYRCRSNCGDLTRGHKLYSLAIQALKSVCVRVCVCVRVIAYTILTIMSTIQVLRTFRKFEIERRG